MQRISFEEFCENVKEDIINFLPEDREYEIQLTSDVKNNDTFSQGLTILEKGINIAPTIYLNSFYDNYTEGGFYHKILKSIVDVYEKNRWQESFDISTLIDYEKAKSQIIRKLINFEENREYLKDKVYKKIEDLAMVYQILVSQSENNIDTVTITEQIMNMYDVSVEELDEVANENTLTLMQPIISSVIDTLDGVERNLYLEEMTESDLGYDLLNVPPMYRISNIQNVNGAAMILNEDIQNKLRDILNDYRFTVLPSSIHEMLVIPYDESFSKYFYNAMIKSVNDDSLPTEDVLSNHAYVVDAQNHVFMDIERAEEYFKELESKKQLEEKREEVIHEENQSEEIAPVRHRLPPEKRNIKL